MSTSPSRGQVGPTIQKAGQAPHACLGKWAKSAMNRPELYELTLSSLTLLRPSSSVLLESTLMVTLSLAVSMRPRSVASFLFRYLTNPWLGSFSLKKANFSKKLEGLYDS